MTNRRYNTTYLLRFTQYILLVTLSGCFTTNVSLPLPPEYSLTQALTPLMNTRVEWPAPATTVGHQFVLAVLPVGSITTRLLTSSLTRALAAASLSQGSPSSRSNPVVPQLITIADVRLSAWDLLLIRHLSCRVEADVCYPNSNSSVSSCTHLVSRASTYHQFAFKPQLQHTLALCLARLSRKIVAVHLAHTTIRRTP